MFRVVAGFRVFLTFHTKNEKIKSLEIIKNVIQDIQILNKKAIQIKQEAEKQSDYATSAVMDNYLGNYAKKLWMLNETIK